MTRLLWLAFATSAFLALTAGGIGPAWREAATQLDRVAAAVRR